MKDLQTIITPSLLTQLSRARIPWPKQDPISGNALIAGYFGGESDFASRAAVAWPALLALSQAYGPSSSSPGATVPDVTRFLPDPASAAFAEQALGMHVLLDQCPRVLFRGADGRWTSWFDAVVRRLYGFLRGLPEAQRPWTRARWAGSADARDGDGAASFEYWFCVVWEFNASMAHQESRVHQAASAAAMGVLRGEVEAFSGWRDPGRDDASRWVDVYAFPRLIEGLDLSRQWAFHEAAFWVIEVVEVHRPIIDRYGRYPYRNAIEGRDSSEEERDWLEKTHHFAEAAPDVARKVREDVEAGRWTPLGKGEVHVSSEASVSITIRTSERRC